MALGDIDFLDMSLWDVFKYPEVRCIQGQEAARAAILHHDFPQRLAADKDFQPVQLPVSL